MPRPLSRLLASLPPRSGLEQATRQGRHARRGTRPHTCIDEAFNVSSRRPPTPASPSPSPSCAHHHHNHHQKRGHSDAQAGKAGQGARGRQDERATNLGQRPGIRDDAADAQGRQRDEEREHEVYGADGQIAAPRYELVEEACAPTISPRSHLWLLTYFRNIPSKQNTFILNTRTRQRTTRNIRGEGEGGSRTAGVEEPRDEPRKVDGPEGAHRRPARPPDEQVVPVSLCPSDGTHVQCSTHVWIHSTSRGETQKGTTQASK